LVLLKLEDESLLWWHYLSPSYRNMTIGKCFQAILSDASFFIYTVSKSTSLLFPSIWFPFKKYFTLFSPCCSDIETKLYTLECFHWFWIACYDDIIFPRLIEKWRLGNVFKPLLSDADFFLLNPPNIWLHFKNVVK